MTNPAFKLDLPNVFGPDGQGRADAWVTYSSVRWKERIATIGDAGDGCATAASFFVSLQG